MRFLIAFIFVFAVFMDLKAQDPVNEKPLATTKGKIDTLAPVTMNQGKVAGRIAAHRSMFLPGLGQVYDYGLVVDDVRSGRIQGKGIGKKLAIVGKIAAIYVAGTMLTLSYIDNNEKYHLFLEELQYRRLNNDQPNPDGPLAGYRSTQDLYTGKAVYKNNREIVLISLALTYGINIVDAYVTARLNYLDVNDGLGIKISPSVIQSGTMYGHNSLTPALKLTLKL